MSIKKKGFVLVSRKKKLKFEPEREFGGLDRRGRVEGGPQSRQIQVQHRTNVPTCARGKGLGHRD